ncbi:MAG: aldo/keto reductase [Paracoccaceae bacterium]
MRQVSLGDSGIMVSEICLGTMTWGTQNTEAEGHAQIDMALDAGVNFLDTAEMYPVNPVAAETVGRTEEIIGSWLAARGGRDRLIIGTKITGAGQGAVRGGAPINASAIRKAVDGSLRRLQTDYIDLYQLHWPNRGSYHFRQSWAFDPSHQDKAATLGHMAEALAALEDLRKAGKIRHIGLSNESAWGMTQWLRLADQGLGPRPVSIQNEYSLLCRLYDTDLAELSVNENIPLLSFSPLACGLLSGKYAGDVIPEGSRRTLNPDLSGRVTPRVWGAISAYLGVAQRAGLDPVQMAIAWQFTRPFAVIPIIGATNTDQLQVVLGAAGLELSAETRAEIAAAHKEHPMPY